MKKMPLKIALALLLVSPLSKEAADVLPRERVLLAENRPLEPALDERRLANFRRAKQEVEDRWGTHPNTDVLGVPRRTGIHLVSGEWIGGKFLGLAAKDGVRWQHPAIKKEMLFRPALIKRIVLPSPTMPEIQKTHVGRVELVNGDLLTGDLLGFTDSKLALDTWYAGKLTINAKEIRQWMPGLNQRFIISNPLLEENWKVVTVAPGQFVQPEEGVLPKEILKRIYALNHVGTPKGEAGWRVEDGNLVTSRLPSWIGRDLELPNRFQINFDLGGQLTRGDDSELEIYLRNGRLADEKASEYRIRISRYLSDNQTPHLGIHTAKIINLNGNRNDIQLEKQKVHVLPRGVSAANLTILIGPDIFAITASTAGFITPSQAISIFKGPGLHKDLEHNRPFKISSLRFNSNSKTPLQIRNLKIQEMQKGIRSELPLNFTRPPAGQTAALMTNGDTIRGSLVSVNHKKARFKSQLGEVELPIDSVRILFFGNELKPSKLNGDRAVEINLYDGGKISLECEEWTANKVIGKTPVLGTLKLNPAAARTMNFTKNHKSTIQQPGLPIIPDPPLVQEEPRDE